MQAIHVSRPCWDLQLEGKPEFFAHADRREVGVGRLARGRRPGVANQQEGDAKRKVRHEMHSYSPLNSFDNVRGDSSAAT